MRQHQDNKGLSCEIIVRVGYDHTEHDGINQSRIASLDFTSRISSSSNSISCPLFSSLFFEKIWFPIDLEVYHQNAETHEVLSNFANQENVLEIVER